MERFPVKTWLFAAVTALGILLGVGLVVFFPFKSAIVATLAYYYTVGIIVVIRSVVRQGFSPLRALFLTIVYLGFWADLSFLFDTDFVKIAGWCGLYLIGLCWAVWYVERHARRIEARRGPATVSDLPLIPVGGEVRGHRGGWNPLDPASRLYGRGSERLRQSLGLLAAYTFLFGLVYFLAHLRFGTANEEFADELPSGGGSDAPQAMSVKVTKVVRKKYVINPYSSILFAAPPPIENIDVKLMEETANRYQVGQGDGGLGQGDGEGGGFGSGTAKGKINWYRLRHADRGWDKNFGIGGDRNLMSELEIRYPKMKGRVAEENTAIDCDMLGRFKEKEPPYLVYVGGYGFAPTASDKKVLKQYLMDRHGMILGDSLGPGFGGGFQAVMTEITGVQPVPIPRDDPIHKQPFDLPQLPFVVAHNGTAPMGWRVDGRWAVYWHPGALSDAWRDDRAGIRKEIATQCYQLGLNVISYGLKEQDKWRRSRQP